MKPCSICVLRKFFIFNNYIQNQVVLKKKKVIKSNLKIFLFIISNNTGLIKTGSFTFCSSNLSFTYEIRIHDGYATVVTCRYVRLLCFRRHGRCITRALFLQERSFVETIFHRRGIIVDPFSFPRQINEERGRTWKTHV